MSFAFRGIAPRVALHWSPKLPRLSHPITHLVPRATMSMSPRRTAISFTLSVALAVATPLNAPLLAAAPRVLPAGEVPDDARLGELRQLNGYHPFIPPQSAEEWEARSAALRRQVLVALGLWPLPERTPPNAVIHGRIDRGDYTVEKVYFESYPDHFVTGNLYRPTGQGDRRPAVLCPHGHWANGRMHDHGDEKILQELAAGAERFAAGGRHPIQARCVQLARMGCVVFNYDMVGYADSVQLEHRAGVRPEMNTPQRWGFFSPQAESRLQTIMGLQAYNSIRALDWLSELPDVDPQRIAVTGASGGGTQTFILCAIDPRPVVAFPAVMVSTDMQGGCTCENASYLRIGTSNVELAALFAPRPLGMTAADDWTREIASKGLPELQHLYRLLGVPDFVMARPLLHFGHNYNHVSRTVMYGWLNQHLGLGFDEPVLEADYEPLSPDEMTVWNDEHPQPPSGDDYERELVATMTDIAADQMQALAPHDAESLDEYRRIVGGALETVIGRRLPSPDAIQHDIVSETQRDGYLEFTALVRHAEAGEALPAVILYPNDWNGEAIVWVDEQGKDALYDTSGSPQPHVTRLLSAGFAVIGADLLYQGEFLADGRPLGRAPMVGNDQTGRGAYAGYTYGYNLPLVSRRVHDILSLVAFAKHHEEQPRAVHVVGTGNAGVWAGLAAAVAGDSIAHAVIDTGRFRFAELTALDDLNFLPGGAKYGDLPGLLALRAPHALRIAGEGDGAPALTSSAYAAADAEEGLVVASDADAAEPPAIAEWLIDRHK